MSGFPADTIFEGYSRSIFDTDPLTRHISVASVRDSIQAMERICQEIEKMLKIRSSSDQRTDNGEKNDTEIASSILSDIPILGIQLAGNVLNVGLVEFLHVDPMYSTLSTQLTGGAITDIVRTVIHRHTEMKRHQQQNKRGTDPA